MQIDSPVFDQVIKEFCESKCDYMQYSFLAMNKHQFEFDGIRRAHSFQYIDVIDYKIEENKKRQEKAIKSYMCKLEFMFKMGSSLRRAKHAQANKSKQKCGSHFEFKLQLSSSNQQARESKSKQKQANLSNSKLKKRLINFYIGCCM